MHTVALCRGKICQTLLVLGEGTKKMMASNFRKTSLINDRVVVLLDCYQSKQLSANRVQRTRMNWSTPSTYSFTAFRQPTDSKLEHFFLNLPFRKDLLKLWDLSLQIGSLSNTSLYKISIQIFKDCK